MCHHEVQTYEGRVMASRASDVLLLDCPSEDILRYLWIWYDDFAEGRLPLVPATGGLGDHREIPESCCTSLSGSDT